MGFLKASVAGRLPEKLGARPSSKAGERGHWEPRSEVRGLGFGVEGLCGSRAQSFWESLDGDLKKGSSLDATWAPSPGLGCILSGLQGSSVTDMDGGPKLFGAQNPQTLTTPAA